MVITSNDGNYQVFFSGFNWFQVVSIGFTSTT